jgi:hypothetical protein
MQGTGSAEYDIDLNLDHFDLINDGESAVDQAFRDFIRKFGRLDSDEWGSAKV